jgi:hypothetical protein
VDGIKRLTRVFGFDDFAQALAFTTRVGELAEEEGHLRRSRGVTGRPHRAHRLEVTCAATAPTRGRAAARRGGFVVDVSNGLCLARARPKLRDRREECRVDACRLAAD